MTSDHIHPEPTTFLRKHVFSTDHKVIAKQFLWFGLIWLGVGGVMAMMLRWQLANPGVPVPLLGGHGSAERQHYAAADVFRSGCCALIRYDVVQGRRLWVTDGFTIVDRE